MSDQSKQVNLSWKKAIILNTLFWSILWGVALWNNYQWSLSVDREFTWNTIFSWSFPYYLSMILIGPCVYFLLIRWVKLSYARQLALHFIPSVFTGFIHQVSLNTFSALFNDGLFPSRALSFSEKISQKYEFGMVFSSNGFLFYWLIIGGFYSLIIYQKYREEELNNLQLKSDLSAAKLQSLQMQLQPHFLFNSFNTLSMMARKNNMEDVVEMVGVLGEFLRESLALKDTQLITVASELEFTRKYLHIQQIRLRDRLTIHLDFHDDLLQFEVPSLLFQPIIENAFKHGIEKTSSPVTFTINGKLEGNRLNFSFFNSGVLLNDDFNILDHAGFGLSSTLRRLNHIYGNDYKFTLINDHQRKGVIAKLNLPLNH